MQAVSLAEVADELYGLPPGEFIAARDERARQAKAAGLREDAAAIRKLARPTTSAWLVNQLHRAAPEQLGRLYEVGAALQEAQRTLAGDRLRELSGQRRQVVGELLPVAAGIARDAGQVASPAVLEEVRATLEAALADQDAREAVGSGRLTKALAYAGLGEVDLAAALAPVPPPPGRTASPAEAGPDADPAAEAIAAAEAAVARAADAVASAERDLAAADEQRQFQRRRIAHLERELAAARNEDARLASDEREARRRRDQEQRELAAAERRLDQARRPQKPPGQRHTKRG